MCNYAKLTLNIDTSKDVIGRVVCNKESQWEAYKGMPSDFITEVFHTPTEEAVLCVFRSYIDNEEYWAERWAGSEEDEGLAKQRNNPCDIAKAYRSVELMIVIIDSGNPIISSSRSCSPRPEVVIYELSEMLDEIAKEKEWEGL